MNSKTLHNDLGQRRWGTRTTRMAAVGAISVAGVALAAGVAVASSGSAPSAPPARPAPHGSPPAKAAAWQKMEQARIAAAGRPVVAPSRPPGMESYIPLGIIGDRQGPFTSSQFSGVNSWTGESGTTVTAVVAGGIPSVASDPFNSPKLAAVFVSTEPTHPVPGERASTPVGIFAPTPDPAGEFRVTAVDGAVLTLVDHATGATYHFDTTTHAFSN